MTGSLARVGLAISTFRSDDEVIALLRGAFRDGASPFGSVIVVDSLGSGAIASEIARSRWPVVYVDSPDNLGSAGNLQKRLEIAAGLDLDWCLCLNHDAELDVAKAARLLEEAGDDPRIGAVYPRLRCTSANDRLDRPRRSFKPFGSTVDAFGEDERDRVKWSSSNGALYRLAPFRSGMTAWPELWMGYEDLAIGYELDRRGLEQILSRDVIVDDNYEFRPIRLPGRTVYMADKPVWYSYYELRNLLLIRRGSGGKALSIKDIVLRGIADFALLAFKDRRWQRARWLARGFVDGLRGRSGKGPAP